MKSFDELKRERKEIVEKEISCIIERIEEILNAYREDEYVDTPIEAKEQVYNILQEIWIDLAKMQFTSIADKLILEKGVENNPFKQEYYLKIKKVIDIVSENYTYSFSEEVKEILSNISNKNLENYIIAERFGNEYLEDYLMDIELKDTIVKNGIILIQELVNYICEIEIKIKSLGILYIYMKLQE